LRGGGLQLEGMPKAEIDEHRQRSRAKDSGPWVSDYDAMALKTTIRKISKYLPKSSEAMSRLLDLDNAADLGLSQNLELPAGTKLGDGEAVTVKAMDRPSRVDALKGELAQRTGAAEDQQQDDDLAGLDAEVAAKEAVPVELKQ